MLNRKRALLAAFILLTAGSVANATVTLELDAGILRTAGGTSLMPQGYLLQIIGTRSGTTTTFVAPTPGSFTGGDNLVVANFAMNYGFNPGETDNQFTFTLENTLAPSTALTFDQNDALLLRWWPTITFDTTTGQPSRAPSAGDPYGEFRSNSGEGGGIAWFTPADGTTLLVPNGLNFLTASTTDFNNNPGPHPDTLGFASLTVVPEPSSVALLATGAVGALVVARRRMRRS